MPEYAFYYNDKNEFCANSLPVRALVKKYSTPLTIISLTQLIENIQRFKRSFAAEWQGKVRVLPAIKANTSIALCRVLASETEGCDLFSEGELKAALEGGFNPRYLSLNGNSKLTTDMKFLEYAIAQGVRITMDDKSEFDAIERIAEKLDKKATVRLRLRPNFSNMNQTSDLVHGMPLASEFAHFAYKAGIPTEEIGALGNSILKSKWFNLTGVHIHLGRHRKDLQYWEAEMKGYAKAIQELKLALNGWEPAEIDIGGGFAQHLDPFVSHEEEKPMVREMRLLNLLNKAAGIFGDNARYRVVSALLRANKKKLLSATGPDLEKKNAPSIEEYSRSASWFRLELNKLGIETKKTVLELEPGRGLFGSASIHVCRVNFIKKQTVPIPWSWVVTDTTDYWLLGANNPPNQPYVVDGKPIDNYPSRSRVIADIAGKSCGPDRITGEACLPGDIGPGDLIIFVGTGAYQEMQSPNFNSMGRPATVAVKGTQEGVIRRRETIEDVFRREEIPDWISG
jgi:diaminopimelate decarboxylase